MKSLKYYIYFHMNSFDAFSQCCYLIVLFEGLPQLFQLCFQLFLVTVTEIPPTHLLSAGEEMKGLLQEEAVLFLQ